MDENTPEIIKILKHNKWTLSYIALILTLLVIIRIWEAKG